ncbi:hypothetical protein HNR77_001510 [Paenibacillus sp. JGP012]|uniref:Uncharacterized protein n=2 Tax=Paenibacillus TaxID=44249 RepID=A0A2V4VMX1_PAEBA|nr:MULTISPECIES: hypothetical protein [Paenibacillus]MBB6020449.1 hypothetical protein [Paenibacillus sp. JGP012]MCK6075334.1 hypothetical protein [Paenibacillus silvae]MCK6149721.1 hypothetical protein [Paenibacillus silvae]MCK6268019.1 hypothetical protein [Paenibacillus silvae]PYE47511.1 hypothetical protein DFQ00_113105 [Paenibacillus barcinonensis]
MAAGRNGKSNKGSRKTNAANTLLGGNLSGKKLELIVAALLVSGKLRVDAVTLFREATLVVELVGQYKTLQKVTPTNSDKLVQFLDETGRDMTLNDVIQAFQQRINS